MKLSVRTWLSIVTFLLVAGMIYASHHELERAWALLFQVNLWVLALFIPLVLLNYYTAGETVFSYLRHKGRIKNVSVFEQMRISLEFNFVNHALPSGGASGMSYMTWRLNKLGVSAGKAAMAQVVRLVVGMLAFVILLVVAVLLITLDGGINRWIILISSSLATVMIALLIGCIFLMQSVRRIEKFSRWSTKWLNRIVRRASFGKREAIVEQERVLEFFMEMHEDYVDIKADKRLLRTPLLWAILFMLTDIALFFIAYWSLGAIVNPGLILISYGLGTIAGVLVVTPGGSGAYEALVVAFLAFAGLSKGTAIAGTVLARALILIVILLIGYLFYQHALVKYGKKRSAKA